MGAAESRGSSGLGGPRAWLVWAIAVAFVVYYFSFQTGYAIVNSSVQKDLGLSIAQVGLIAAIYTWVFALCQFMSGPLLDRLGARKVLLPAILLVTLGIFVFANAGNFEMLLLSQALIAIGACTGFVGAGYVGGMWFGWAKFSFMFGLVQFAASLFSAFNQNLLNWSLTVFPWHQLFNVGGTLGIVLLLAAVLYLRDPAPVEAPAGQSLGSFLGTVRQSFMTVARLPHIWMAAAFGSLCFGVMLGLGVVWGPKLLMARGIDAATANTAASFLWLGLAAGCFVAPWISDNLQRRKLPILIGIAIQIVTLTLLLYLKPIGPAFDVLLCFLFGFGNSAHMLAFSTAADVVEPKNIGTSAAIVNGIMFILGGIMISRPGVRIGLGIEEGIAPSSLEMAQFAARPLQIGVCVAFVIALIMRETYPRGQGASR
ncbi:MAG TPA: MFS transporter [Pseudolabrys sp.]|nr:MFS transporter [Pseudolabrys sp.]